MQGKTATTYRPTAFVSRAEMAMTLVRAHDAVATKDLPAGNTSSTFAPLTRVTRAQMATFVSRTLDLLVATGQVAPR